MVADWLCERKSGGGEGWDDGAGMTDNMKALA